MYQPLAHASNFPTGFNNVTIRGVPITQSHPGAVFWASSASTAVMPGQVGSSDGNTGSFNSPCSSLAGALLKCTANRGDIIFVKPGHTETISSATALALSTAGVAIIGLGVGTKRPTFTLDTANTTTIAVSADNCSVINCKFVGNFLSIAACFTVGAAANFTVQDCDFSDTSVISNFFTAVTTTASVNADNLALIRNRVVVSGTTVTTAPFTILGTMSGLYVDSNAVFNTIDRSNVSVFLSHAALVMSNAVIMNNMLYCLNSTNTSVGMFISTSATTGSGLVINNIIRGLDAAAALIITAAAVQYGMFNNLYEGDGTQNSGFVLPAIGSDS